MVESKNNVLYRKEKAVYKERLYQQRLNYVCNRPDILDYIANALLALLFSKKEIIPLLTDWLKIAFVSILKYHLSQESQCVQAILQDKELCEIIRKNKDHTDVLRVLENKVDINELLMIKAHGKKKEKDVLEMNRELKHSKMEEILEGLKIKKSRIIYIPQKKEEQKME